MADIQVKCEHCGGVFKVSSSRGGLGAACPYCSQQTPVPLAPEPLDGRSVLQINRTGTAGGGQLCPDCGTALEAEALFCVRCGYNFKTGRRIGAGWFRHSLALKISIGLAVVVVVAGLVLALRSFFQPAPQSIPAPPPGAATQAAATVASEVSWAAREPAPAGVAPASIPPSDVVAVARAEVVIENDEDLRAQLVATVSRQMDSRFPLLQVGETAVLRRVSGVVHRGVYLGLAGSNAVLIVQGKARADIPLAQLDRDSRLRCDRIFRGQWLDDYIRAKYGRMSETDSGLQ